MICRNKVARRIQPTQARPEVQPTRPAATPHRAIAVNLTAILSHRDVIMMTNMIRKI
jgi:hypothetical protein